MRAPKDYIVFPLDVESFDEAERYIDLLYDEVGVFKVGLELFIRDGKRVIERIQKMKNSKIFLDLKLHDIPETVRRAMSGILDLNIQFATVIIGESRKMLEYAVAGSNGHIIVLGVTLLTSVSKMELNAYGIIGGKEKGVDPLDVVIHRAKMAKDAGLNGVVCSPLEVREIKRLFGKDLIAMVPGIRPQFLSTAHDDQERIATPRKAIEWGADYLVIGRPLRDAKDPVEAARRIQEEISLAC